MSEPVKYFITIEATELTSENEFGIQGTSLWPQSSHILKDGLSLWQENLS